MRWKFSAPCGEWVVEAEPTVDDAAAATSGLDVLASATAEGEDVVVGEKENAETLP
jgi:hypothetical protein